jgi:Flp pilus assembly protein TadG
MMKRRTIHRENGTSLAEFSIVLPLILITLLGLVEVSYALLDQHIVTKLSREGSNLISRDTDLPTAANVLKGMSTRPVNFDDGTSKVIFTVIKNVSTTGAMNYNQPVVYARFVYGTYTGSSQLTTAGTGGFGGGSLPGYQASDPGGDTALRLTNLPVTVPLGGWLYVTEIYTRHELITPFANFGGSVPDHLYSIAFF